MLGREPQWKLVPRRLDPDTKKPTPAQKALMDEASDFLTGWWDDRNVAETMQGWLTTLLWGQRSDLRFFTPPGFYRNGTLTDGTAVRYLAAATPAEALAQLFLEDLRPEEGIVYEHPDTRQKASVYLYTLADTMRAELTWVDPVTGITLQRQLGSSLQAAPARLNLGGRLLMDEARHPEFISEQVRQLQRALNLALTMLPHNLVTGGFLEMVVLSGQMPGHWEPDTSAPSGRRFIAHPMARGAQMVNWIQGEELGDDNDGVKHKTTPTVAWRPPTPLNPTIDGIAELRARMLDVADQVHVLMNSSAEPSGRSRDSARTEFGGSLRKPYKRTQRSGRWVIETALAWVELLTNQPGRWTNELRCEFTPQLDLGPVSVEDRLADNAQVEANIMAVDTARERAGIEDVDAEESRIQGSRRGQIQLAVAEAEAVQLWVDLGLDFPGACIAAGVPEERRTELASHFHEPPPPPEAGSFTGQRGAPRPGANANNGNNGTNGGPPQPPVPAGGRN